VARFIGDSNIIEDGIFVEDLKVSFDGKIFTCVDKGFGKNEKNIDIVIRPEDIDIVSESEGFFSAIIKSIAFKGVH
jgi:spermidine/putrescine transport system ATP-binding protein